MNSFKFIRGLGRAQQATLTKWVVVWPSCLFAVELLRRGRASMSYTPKALSEGSKSKVTLGEIRGRGR